MLWQLKAREGPDGEVWLDMVLDRTRFKRVRAPDLYTRSRYTT